MKHTEACLTQLIATLPAGFRGEILVVDDASTDETPAVMDRWAATCPFIRVIRSDENRGFGQSCNRGAEAAAGEILVFLNNDTLPQAGWLRPLIRLLERHQLAGAVGGKLLYPDGTLQEAGAVIFSDASGCNFGRGDSRPNAPLFNFVREVDYCSAALLAIRRSLFLELGGFDLAFSPAYYEDTDLCFRLREKGYRVYLPASERRGTHRRCLVRHGHQRGRETLPDAQSPEVHRAVAPRVDQSTGTAGEARFDRTLCAALDVRANAAF